MNFQIVTCTPRHAAAASALINRAYRGDAGWTIEGDIIGGLRITVESLEADLHEKHKKIFVAMSHKELVGTIRIEKAETRCHLGLFAVTPDHQAQGIGKKLLGYAETYAKTVFGCTRMQMQVLSPRPELIAYYVRRGYHVRKKETSFPDDLDPSLLKKEGLFMTFLEKLL